MTWGTANANTMSYCATEINILAAFSVINVPKQGRFLYLLQNLRQQRAPLKDRLILRIRAT